MPAQKKFTDNLSGMINYHAGYNLPEYPFIVPLTEDYVRSLDISLVKETVGKNLWEQLYNYPEYGVSLFYSTLGNDEVFGRELALTYFVRLYFLSRKRFRLYNRTGIGLSYITRKFDLNNNYLNVAVGSHLNAHFNFRIGGNYVLTKKISLNLGVSFNHLSSANTSEPNLGLNYMTGYGGVTYRLGEQTEKQTLAVPPHTKENSFLLFASVGGKRSRSLASQYFLTSSLSLEFNRALTRKFRFGLGGDLFFDNSVRVGMEKKEEEYKPSDRFQTGIHASVALVYGKLSLSIQQGIYLLLLEKVGEYPLYNRGTIQYQVNPHLALRLAMKSHFNVLDFPEVGVGYTFKR